MTKILAIHGALEIDNFGDVLLGRIFCDWARDAGWRVAAPSAEPKVAAQLGNLAKVDYAGADKILYVGGGYFGEPPRTLFGRLRWGRRLVSLHLDATAVAREKGVPFAVAGVGAGPISNPFARKALRDFLNQASLIAVRDEESAAFLRRLNVRPSVEITADAALSLFGTTMNEKAKASRQALIDQAAGRRILVLHVAKPGAQDKSYAKIYDALSKAELPSDILVVSVADQSGTAGAAQQIAASDQIASIWPATLNMPYTDVDTLIGVISAADYVVTTKLHVGIVASALQRRILAFPAHTKTARFYRQIGQREQCMPLSKSSVESMTVGLKRLINSLPVESGSLALQVDKALRNRDLVNYFLQR